LPADVYVYESARMVALAGTIDAEDEMVYGFVPPLMLIEPKEGLTFV
jgi:hypothetical protein